MREFLPRFPDARQWEVKAVVFFLVTALLTILGPFSTYDDMAFWTRLAYWLILMTGVGFFMHVASMVALQTRLLRPLGVWPRLMAGAVVAGLPGAAVVFFVDGVFRGAMLDPHRFPQLWLQVTCIGIPLCILEFSGQARSRGPAEQTVCPLLRRLPRDIGQDIVSLSMQDHYVEVSTTKGKALLLLRMSDAIGETAGLDGLQVHRSHWVARAHIAGRRRKGQRQFVLLSDGRVLPVSATYAGGLDRT